MNKLIIIDGNSLMNRAFYALPPLTAKDGRITNAVFGFCKILFKIISETKPTHFLVTFDLKAPTFRHLMYADYKGTRHKMPDELAEQMPLIKDVLRAMNIKILEKEGIEADDIIGTISKRFDCPTIIVTGDRDSLQLVDASTTVWLTKKGISEIDELNNDNFKEKMGITPKQIIDLKSMMGDSADNIPGIIGIGEKSAYEFLNAYGTLEGLYENIDQLKGAKEKKVREGKELAFLSKELATIKTDCDIECTLDDMLLSLPFSHDVEKLFEHLQFTSLINKNEFFLDKQDSTQENSTVSIKNTILSTNEEVLTQLKCVKNRFAIINVEDKIHFAYNTNQNFICDIDKVSLFIDIIKDEKIKKIYYNAKLIHKQCFQSLDKLSNFFDVLIASHLIDNEIKQNKKIEENLEDFGGKNTCATSLFNAYEILSKKIENQNLQKIYNEIELPLENVLYNMEKHGVRIDTEILTNLTSVYDNELLDIEHKIYALAGEEFNLNSPKQLSSILFDKLNIPDNQNKKHSTKFEILEKLEGEHPILSLIIRYRKLSKLVSTYLKGFTKYLDNNNIVHTEFEQTITSTGRLSSTNPNLQNIPVKDEDGKTLRKMFVPKNEDYIFVGADYNQVELRLLAHFSQDELLLKEFRNNKDIHSATASSIFDVDFEDVTPEMRRIAKVVNFGIIYGMSEYGLSQTLKISPKTAKEYIDKYFATYKKVKKFMNHTVEKAKSDRFVTTLLGRKRFIPELQSSNKMQVKLGERIAMNTPLQGTGSEIIKLAMLEIDKKINELNLKAQLILQIHDELIIECPKTEEEIVTNLLKNTMENIVSLSVPLPVSLNIGNSWYEI